MSLPNTLTVSRIVLTVIFIFLILMTGSLSKIAAAIIFLIASFTDFYDGYYAKKHNLISNFGKLMDPIADKFLILAAFFIFVQMHLIALWMFMVVLFREFVITGLRLFVMQTGKVLPAEKAGKIKTVSQIVTICFILIFIILKESDISLGWSVRVFSGWQYSIYTLMLMTVTLTMISGILYLWSNRHSFYVQ